MSQSFDELLNKCPKVVLQEVLLSLAGKPSVELELLLTTKLAWHARHKALARVACLTEEWREKPERREEISRKRQAAWRKVHRCNFRYMEAKYAEEAHLRTVGRK